MRIVLFRHGLTGANERHLYCGSADPPLSEGGILALRALRASGVLPPIEGLRIVTSGARRCEETLIHLYGDMPHEVDRDLWEMDFGAFELRSYAELKDDPAYIDWISGDNEANVCPGGESGEIMRARVLAALDRLLLDGRPAALFTHGGPIAAVMDSLFPAEKKNRYQWQPVPGGGYIIDTSAGSYMKICKV